MDVSFKEKVQLLQNDIENCPYHIFGDTYFCTGNKTEELNQVPSRILDGSFQKIQEIIRRLKINTFFVGCFIYK